LSIKSDTSIISVSISASSHYGVALPALAAIAIDLLNFKTPFPDPPLKRNPAGGWEDVAGEFVALGPHGFLL